MKAERQKFPFKKILEHLTHEESSFATIRGFFRNTEEGERKSAETIVQITKQLGSAAQKTKNKQLIKGANNFCIHKMQLEQAEDNVRLISQKINYWLDEVSEKYKILKEKAKDMERRKDTLTTTDIQAYKQELKKQLTAVTQTRNSIVCLYAHQMVKNHSQQLETITNLMQNQHSKISRVIKKDR